MSVRIDVAKGPDQGKSYALDARAEMRIGRGPGNHLMIQDPDWQGTLRVSFGQGVCKVTNQMPTTIYLGGKIFPPGEQRPWFHGESLQPTAQTLLILYVEEPGKGVGRAAPSRSRKMTQLLVIGICLPLAAVLFLLPSDSGTDKRKSSAELQQDYQRLEGRLLELQKAEGGDVAERVLTLLKEARYERMRNHPTQAFALYKRLREEVESDLRGSLHPRPLPEDVSQTLRDVREFLNQEMIALGPQAQKKS